MPEAPDLTLDQARELLWKFVLERDSPAAFAAKVVFDAADAQTADHAALLAAATWFQSDYTRKLPVIAAFRRWRNGSYTDAEFLAVLRGDDVGPVLGYEPVAPMEGLKVLNDHRDFVENAAFGLLDAARDRKRVSLVDHLTEKIRDLREKGPRTTDVLNDCDMALAALRGEFGAGRDRARNALERCVQRINERAEDK